MKLFLVTELRVSESLLTLLLLLIVVPLPSLNSDKDPLSSVVLAVLLSAVALLFTFAASLYLSLSPNIFAKDTKSDMLSLALRGSVLIESISNG